MRIGQVKFNLYHGKQQTLWLVFEIWGDVGNWDYQHGLSIRTAGAIESILPIVEPGSSIVLQNTAKHNQSYNFKGL